MSAIARTAVYVYARHQARTAYPVEFNPACAAVRQKHLDQKAHCLHQLMDKVAIVIGGSAGAALIFEGLGGDSKQGAHRSGQSHRQGAPECHPYRRLGHGRATRARSNHSKQREKQQRAARDCPHKYR